MAMKATKADERFSTGNVGKVANKVRSAAITTASVGIAATVGYGAYKAYKGWNNLPSLGDVVNTVGTYATAPARAALRGMGHTARAVDVVGQGIITNRPAEVQPQGTVWRDQEYRGTGMSDLTRASPGATFFTMPSTPAFTPSTPAFTPTFNLNTPLPTYYDAD